MLLWLIQTNETPRLRGTAAIRPIALNPPNLAFTFHIRAAPKLTETFFTYSRAHANVAYLNQLLRQNRHCCRGELNEVQVRPQATPGRGGLKLTRSTILGDGLVRVESPATYPTRPTAPRCCDHATIRSRRRSAAARFEPAQLRAQLKRMGNNRPIPRIWVAFGPFQQFSSN